MPDLPRFPNQAATYGTGLPVVSALLASVSAAFLVVPIANSATQGNIGFLPWSVDQVAISLGSLATATFSLAAISSLYAHAACFDELEDDQKKQIIGSFLPSAQTASIASWRTLALRYYKGAMILWVNGVSLLALTLGVLVLDKVRFEIVAASLVATIAAMGNFQRGISRWLSFPLFFFVFGTGITISIAAFM